MLTLFWGASPQETEGVAFIVIFLWLPVASLLLLCFAVPLALPSQPHTNRYGPNPSEAQK